MSKQAERDYPLKVDPKLFETLPFSCPRSLREFAAGMEIFQKVLPPGSHVLDLGCGTGWTSAFLARAGYDVVGVDISEPMIEMAWERIEREGVPARFVVADMEELDLEQKVFDGVLLFDSLHHCPGYAQVLERAWLHLRPGGCLMLLEPSWLHLLSRHARAATRTYGVTELGFTRWGLSRAPPGRLRSGPVLLRPGLAVPGRVRFPAGQLPPVVQLLLLLPASEADRPGPQNARCSHAADRGGQPDSSRLDPGEHPDPGLRSPRLMGFHRLLSSARTSRSALRARIWSMRTAPALRSIRRATSSAGSSSKTRSSSTVR